MLQCVLNNRLPSLLDVRCADNVHSLVGKKTPPATDESIAAEPTERFADEFFDRLQGIIG